MKIIYRLILMCLLAMPILVFSQNAKLKSITAVNYTMSIDNDFKNGNNGGYGGDYAADVVATIDAANGWMNVAVNKKISQNSVLLYYMGNCWTDKLILNPSNRFMEFRVKCDSVQTKPMEVNTWDTAGYDCYSDTAKKWPGNTFVIPKANTWTTVFLKIPNTTGGSQNVVDTVSSGVVWKLANGNYTFDYIKMGNAAIPPIPTMDIVKTKWVNAYVIVYNITLTGIKIPGRLLDGLTISANSLSKDILNDVAILDSGSGGLKADSTNTFATATLQFTPNPNYCGDSIIITLYDSIRNTTFKTSFYVHIIYNICERALSDIADKIELYPTTTNSFVTLNLPDIFTGEINVVDMVGNIVATQKIEASASALIDLSAVAPGMYFIKISDGKQTFTKKVVKQ
jgi:hypothetical protein